MNSDQPNPEIAPPPETGQEATTTRRRRTRRTVAADTPPDAAAEIAAIPETSAGPAAPPEEAATPGRPRRSRARRAATAEPATPAAPEATTTAPEAAPSIMMPLSTGDALVADAEAADQVAGDGPLTRTRRRRRGRGGRGAEGETETPMTDEAAETAATAAVSDEASGQVAADAVPEEAAAAEETGAGRRRRRRGRGGRGNAAAETVAIGEQEDVDTGLVEVSDLAEPDLAAPEPEEPARPSPAVLRRFDRRNWRERPGRAGAGPRPATPAAAAQAPAAVAQAPATEPAAPVPFTRRPERAPRYGDRRPAASPADLATPPAASAEPPPLASVPPVTPPPTVMPEQVPAPRPAPAASAGALSLPERAAAQPLTLPAGGALEERLERLLSSQVALLQQQQQAMQSMMSTISALQGAIERMTTTGIAAGMPRAGIFVDAPNIIYAAENARVNIDYGRMLDFLGRGREMVHAIVYAPVTEEGGYRFEGQRFVAPFLRKGYKLVTKPLKRFPDGTAKGNFDIELAIDIVTMSQRLDVVILISGDSDFSRLIELIQSRGVRVEVVAFASNVSWELVQMADVFIDMGQYLNEFRAI